SLDRFAREASPSLVPTRHMWDTLAGRNRNARTSRYFLVLAEDAVQTRSVDTLGCSRWSFEQIPPTNRPGFSVLFGSRCRFAARISGSASPGFPHASSRTSAFGRRKSTTDPPWPSTSQRSCSTAADKRLDSPSSRSAPTPVACTTSCHCSFCELAIFSKTPAIVAIPAGRTLVFALTALSVQPQSSCRAFQTDSGTCSAHVDPSKLRS